MRSTAFFLRLTLVYKCETRVDVLYTFWKTTCHSDHLQTRAQVGGKEPIPDDSGEKFPSYPPPPPRKWLAHG